MNHRSLVHPSKKPCRDFPGKCPRSSEECWYVHVSKEHVETNTTSQPGSVSTWSFRCEICGEEIKGRKDFMNHKKKKHEETILMCEAFLKGQ